MTIQTAFRSVHPDFRSRNGFIWPFPGGTATASGPFTDNPDTGCPAQDGDGICLALTTAGAASGNIPFHTVLVCEYDDDPSNLLGTEPDGSKIRVKQATVLSVHDFPAILRNDPHAASHPALPAKANLSGATLYGADLYGANLSRANLSRADLYGANLNSANLSRANLSRADLSGANLSRADLSGANLYSANADQWTALPRSHKIEAGKVVPA